MREMLLGLVSMALVLGCAGKVPMTAHLPGPERATLTPGDVIAVQVYPYEELNRTIEIPDDYLISFPLVGELDVRDMDVGTLRRKLTAELSRHLLYPHVDIGLERSPSRDVFVLGEVERPGGYDVRGVTGPIELVARAGGFTVDANRGKVVLIRGRGESAAIRQLDLSEFLSGEEPFDNPPLASGDVLYVPTSGLSTAAQLGYRVRLALSPIIGTGQAVLLGWQVERAVGE
jgi:polysaccharide export outer membrane protein